MTELHWLSKGTNVHKGLKPSKIAPKIFRLETILTIGFTLFQSFPKFINLLKVYISDSCFNFLKNI